MSETLPKPLPSSEDQPKLTLVDATKPVDAIVIPFQQNEANVITHNNEEKIVIIEHNPHSQIAEVTQELKSIHDSTTAMSEQTDSETPLTEEAQKAEDYRKFQTLVMINSAAVGYALGQVNTQTTVGSFENYTAFSENPLAHLLTETAKGDGQLPEWKRKRIFKQEKKRAISALLELYDLDKLPKAVQEEEQKKFDEKWEDSADIYQGIYKKILTATNPEELQGDDSTRATAADNASSDATTIFRENILKFRRKDDMSYDWERKVEMFTNLGYTREDALKAAAKVVVAAGFTVAFSSIAEAGGAVAVGKGAVEPWLRDTPVAAQVGVSLLSWIGFYAATREYAKASAKLANKTGFAFHVFPTTIANFGKAMNIPYEKMQQNTVKAMWGLALALDAAYASSFLVGGDKGSSMWSNANLFGVGFTGAQIGLTIGAYQAAEIISKQQRIAKVRKGEYLTKEESADLEILENAKEAYHHIEEPSRTRTQSTQKTDPYLKMKGL